ncbi:unnamed protein product [Larinioides sclopetarius]|uniref:Uncharacterized protein n=1 Tax=Larinioides sclopetarius TaxID=280406 RepID=A0AAV1ZEA2_9ARAC
MTALWSVIIVIFLYQRGSFADFLTDVQETCFTDGSCWNYYEINYLPITEKDLNLYCPTTAYSLACLAAETKETCGETKSNMVMDILNRAKILKLVGCTEANIEELNTSFFDFLKLNE